MIAFNKYYNQFNILSISLVIISLLLLIFKGLNFGIDFKGGTLIELRSTDSKINVSSLRDNLNQMNLGDISVKASLLDKGLLDITLWADRTGTASLMKNMLSELTFELERYQIITSNTSVITGRRVRENSAEINDTQGSFLDLQT